MLAKALETCVADAERLVAAGRHEEALQIAENGLKKFPTALRLRNVVQYVRRAGAHKRLAQLKAMVDERKDERAYRELISIYLDLARTDLALEVAQKYVSEFDNTPEAHVHMAEVYLARYFGELFARDAWTAHEHLQRALELDAAALRARGLLALLYYSVGAHRHAANELTELTRLDPANTRFQEFRDELAARSEEQPEGEEDVEILLDRAEETQQLPNDPSVFPGGRRFSVENRGGALSPKLFASAAAGIG
ncbi:MAG: tetratricopeptide repeat protein, partial [Planctomycetota bacterium]